MLESPPTAQSQPSPRGLRMTDGKSRSGHPFTNERTYRGYDLDRKYRIAIAVVAALVVSNEVLVQPYMMRLTTDAPLINVAGRQRMLSQRLAKADPGLRLRPAWRRRAGANGVSRRDEARCSVFWSASHEQLLQGGARICRGPARTQKPCARGSWALSLISSRCATQRGESSGRAGEGRPAVDGTHGPGGTCRHPRQRGRIPPERMDRVVGLYENEARGRIDNLRRVTWGGDAGTDPGESLAAIGRCSSSGRRPG